VFAPAGVDGLKFVGKYGTATVTVRPFANKEVDGGAWLVGPVVGDDPLLQADAMTATPPRRASATCFSSTEVTGRP
jgi:hypothetical protein